MKSVKPSASYSAVIFFLLALALPSPAQQTSLAQDVSQIDSDGDGLSDTLEQALLLQFAPSFMVGKQDCSNLPAVFEPASITPRVKSEDGTIYGQVSPVRTSPQAGPLVEIRYYHLWRLDCGQHGHPLDTEHVAALVQLGHDGPTSWKALDWYAAAHENTVCDVSQIARASTLHAETRGPAVWVSPGKHASYLNETLCQRGCGADRCQQMSALPVGRLINLGEPGHPMNDAAFIASSQWPLDAKMRSTNFPSSALARLDRLPGTDIAWFNPGRHPAQQIIAISSSTKDTIAEGGHNTDTAISLAGDSARDALGIASDATGSALHKSYRKTRHALGTSLRHTGDALHVRPRVEPPPGKPE